MLKTEHKIKQNNNNGMASVCEQVIERKAVPREAYENV